MFKLAATHFVDRSATEATVGRECPAGAEDRGAIKISGRVPVNPPGKLPVLPGEAVDDRFYALPYLIDSSANLSGAFCAPATRGGAVRAA